MRGAPGIHAGSWRARVCWYDGVAGEGSAGSGGATGGPGSSDGNGGGDGAQAAGGVDEGDRARAAAAAAAPAEPPAWADLPADAPVQTLTPALRQQLGLPQTDEETEAGKVARAFVDRVISAIPAAGFFSWLSDYATRKGYAVEPAALPEAPTPGGAYGGPYRTDILAPAPAPAAPGRPDPDFPFLTGGGSPGPYVSGSAALVPSAAALAALAGALPTDGAQDAPAASGEAKNGILGPLAVAALVTAAVAYG